jgi:hypothetical protein
MVRRTTQTAIFCRIRDATPIIVSTTVSQSVIPPTIAIDPSKYGALADVQSWTCTGTQQMTLRGEGPVGEYVVDLKRDPISPSASNRAQD